MNPGQNNQSGKVIPGSQTAKIMAQAGNGLMAPGRINQSGKVIPGSQTAKIMAQVGSSLMAPGRNNQNSPKGLANGKTPPPIKKTTKGSSIASVAKKPLNPPTGEIGSG